MRKKVRTAETSGIKQYVYNLIVCLHSILFQTCSRNMQITRSININESNTTESVFKEKSESVLPL